MQKKDKFLVDHQKGFLIQDRDKLAPENSKNINQDCAEFLQEQSNSVAGNLVAAAVHAGNPGVCGLPDEQVKPAAKK